MEENENLPTHLFHSPKMEQLIRLAKEKRHITSEDCKSIYVTSFRIKEVISFLIANKVLKLTDYGKYQYIYINPKKIENDSFYENQ